MKRLNFDNLKNLDVPDSWIENALSIPANHKRKVYSFWNFSRIASMVACFAVVCLTSFSVFLFMNDNGHIPVSSSTSTVDTTEKNVCKHSTNNAVETTDTETESHFTHSQISEIISASTQEATEKTKGSDATIFTTEPTENLIVDGSLKPQETENQECPVPSVATVATTVPITQQPTTIPETQMLTTQPLVVIPTTVAPTIDWGWSDIQSVGICYGNFSKAFLVGNVYCRLYDVNGNLMGDSNLYSSQHLAHYIIESGDKVYVQYLLEKADLNLSSGTYSYCFYNGNGDDLYQGLVNI